MSDVICTGSVLRLISIPFDDDDATGYVIQSASDAAGTDRMTNLIQFLSCGNRSLALRFSPEHHSVNKDLRFLTSNVTQSRNQLIKAGVYTWRTYLLSVWLNF